MHRFAIALAFISVAVLAGCEKDDKPHATTSAPVATVAQAVQSTGAARESLTFSNDGSKVEFVGRKVTASHDGSFTKFGGKVELAGGKPEASSVTVEIDMASLVIDPPKLLGHLKTPDLLDVEKFPKARFTSTSVTPGGAAGATHTITGNLELHGVTRSITFPAKLAVAPDAVTASAEFSINRKDFGIVYPGMPDDLIKDDVLIRLTIKAPRKG